jgi:hypothetical protein
MTAPTMIGIHHWKSTPRKVKCFANKSMSALRTERTARHQKISFSYFLIEIFCEESQW